jgi:hypothetical protein
MAITIKQQLTGFALAGNDQFFVVDSDNNDEDNFKYIVDLYQGATLIHRELVPVRPDNGYGVFNAKSVVSNLVSFDFGGSSFVTENANSRTTYTIKFGEQYEVAGVITNYTDLTTSNTIVAWNGSIHPYDYLSFDSTDFALTASTKLWLTNEPIARNIKLNQNAWIYGRFASVPAGTIKLKVEVYNGEDTTLTSITITPATYFRIAVGSAQINAAVPTTIPANTVWYSVQLYVDATIISQKITYTVYTSCKYPTYRLHFLNELGGFDAFNFDMLSRKTNSIEKKTFSKNPYEFTGDTIAMTTTSRGKGVYYSRSETTRTLKSNWITEAQSTWLSELFESPEVYLEDSGTLYAVSVKQTGYEYKDQKADKLFNIELEIDFSIGKTR